MHRLHCLPLADRYADAFNLQTLRLVTATLCATNTAQHTPKLAVNTIVCPGLVSCSPTTTNLQTTSSTVADRIWNSLCDRGNVHSRKRVSSFRRVTQAILRQITASFDHYASQSNAEHYYHLKRQQKINNNIPFPVSDESRMRHLHASASSSAVQL